MQAEAEEAERQAEETALVTDLGHAPSYAERIVIEQLSVLIVRGRHLRRSGHGADAEMIARLVIRGLGKLGIRQGTATKADPAKSAQEWLRAEVAS